MKTIYLLKKLERYPLFTENDVSKIIDKSPEYVKNLLYRLNKESHIKRIERGKYTSYDDVMIFASYMAAPSYLGLWTAFRHYNWTQQQPSSISILSSVSKRNITFQNTDVIFLKTKHMFGYRKERYSDFDILISDKEKTIIDALLFHLPIEDIISALSDEEIDYEKLRDYALKTKNISLIKRLGYLLKKEIGNAFGLKAMDNNYIKLDYLGKRIGKKDPDWKLIINMQT